MTAYFLDSSALIKRYITETGSTWVESIVKPDAGHRILIAQITPVEMVSALTRRKRNASISTRTAKSARILIDRHVRRREYRVVELSQFVVYRAEDLLETHPLRAYDAVQLASALEANAHLVAAELPPLVFVSADQRLLTVADHEGLPTENPNDH